MAIYPNGILNWTQRVNGDIVWANDPNSLAAEVSALEQYVGINPQNEPSPLTGAPKSFSSLSSRVSAAMLQSGHPFVQLSGTGQVFQSNNAQNLSHFGCHHTDYDWDDYVSGGSINIQDAGIWLVHSMLGWPYVSGGWVTHCHFHDSDLMRRSIFDWDNFPSSGSNYYGERYLNQVGHTETTYIGYIPAGTTIGIYVGNMCNENPVTINSAELSAYFLRP